MKIYRLLALTGLGVFALTACGSSDTATTSSAPARVTYEDGQVAKVVSVDSGNTVTVDIDGVSQQVRMVNVTAPSANNNLPSGSCLMQESTDYLAGKLPVGSEVTLQFDDSRVGSTGYLDAAIYLGEQSMNTDIVRAGLAATTFSSAKDEFYTEISAAQQEAAREGVNLYSADVECTIPARIKAAKDAIEPAGAIEDEAQRKAEYQRISDVYNDLHEYEDAPANYTGSIVTLEAVTEQLEDLRKSLGANYYDANGKSEADHAQESAVARPGS